MELPNCVYRVALRAIIKNSENKFLLIQEKDYGWELPGGGLEHGEEPHEGLAREIEEELGCTVTKVADAPSAFWTIESTAYVKHFSYVAYVVEISGDFKFSNEAEQIGWFSLDEIQKLKLHETTRDYFGNPKNFKASN